MSAIRMLNCVCLTIIEIIIVKVITTHFSFKFFLLLRLGKISYELFLTEGIFFWNKILYDLAGYNYCGLVLHLLVIIAMALLLRKLTIVTNKVLVHK